MHYAVWHWGVGQAASSSCAWRFSRVPPAARWVRTIYNAIAMQRCWHLWSPRAVPLWRFAVLRQPGQQRATPRRAMRPMATSGVLGATSLGGASKGSGGRRVCINFRNGRACRRRPAGPAATADVCHHTPNHTSIPRRAYRTRPWPTNTRHHAERECHASDDRTSPLPAPHSFFCKSSNAKNRKAASLTNACRAVLKTTMLFAWRILGAPK